MSDTRRPSLTDVIRRNNERAAEIRAARTAGDVPTGDTSGQRALLDAGGGRSVAFVYLDQIVVDPDQPRKLETFTPSTAPESIQELAESIRTLGLVNPITVDRFEGRFKIIAGERRYHALCLNRALHGGPDQVLAYIWGELDEDSRLALQLHENFWREPLSREEVRDTLRRRVADVGNVSEVCRRFGISRATYYRIMGGDEKGAKAARVSTGQFVQVAERLRAKVRKMSADERGRLLPVVEALVAELRAASRDDEAADVAQEAGSAS